MSEFISILRQAYSSNFIDEGRAALEATQSPMNSRQMPTEEAIAKVSHFGLKLIGSTLLLGLGLSVLGAVRKRSISISRLFLATVSFFLTFDTLKGSNNLKSKYTTPITKSSEGLGRMASRAWNQGQNFAEESTQTPDKALQNRVIRVFKAAVKDTKVFEPLSRAAGLV